MNPEIEEVLLNFREFLKQHDIPDKIVWVGPEHTIYCGGMEWKIFEGEGISERDIIVRYKAAKERAFGVRFCVLCANHETTYCYLYVPVDESDAEYQLLMNGGVKMSIPQNVPNASMIRRGIRALWYQLKESVQLKTWKNMAFRIG